VSEWHLAEEVLHGELAARAVLPLLQREGVLAARPHRAQ
jgi:hypothetical protein